MKRLFYIFVFVLGLSFCGYSQAPNALTNDPSVKVVKFYPNPAVSYINFEFLKSVEKEYSFQIYNFLGKKVLDIKAVTPKLNVPLTDFYRGVYIYQLRDRAGRIIESGKFQVNK